MTPSLRDANAAQFEEVAREQRWELAPPSDDMKLARAALESLSLALIVARLGSVCGVDPSDADEAAGFASSPSGGPVALHELYESQRC